jgi:nucleoside-diphosphate-sugar epimerase
MSSTHIDVRDVAHKNVWAVENPEKTDDQQYIAISGIQSNQAIADFIFSYIKGNENVEFGHHRS